MRRAAFVGTMITFVALVFGLMQVASVGANSANLPALQETATATEDADTTATADTTTTADTDTTATVGTTVTPEEDTTATAGSTATAEADTTATVGVTAETTATTGATAATGTTATSTSLGQLPNTGGSSGPNLTLLVIGAALLVLERLR